MTKKTCSLKKTERCNGDFLRTYFKDTEYEMVLCRQCRAKLGVNFVATSADDGVDIETMFRDIMTSLAALRSPCKK